VQSWGDYASEHFQRKHDLDGNIARIKAASTAAFAAIDAALQADAARAGEDGNG
jgi:hypothetical protein